MKFIEKDSTLAVSYDWDVEEINTEGLLIKVIEKIAEIGELLLIEFHGYEDMDEHGNWALFHSVDEMKNGVKDLPKIEPDEATVRIMVNGKMNLVSFYWDDGFAGGVRMCLICGRDEVEAEKVAKAVEKVVKGVIK